MILRIEDLDPQRCRPEFRSAIIEDLAWFGLDWAEGPDVSGRAGSYLQSGVVRFTSKPGASFLQRV